ncbi:hypothetical protein IF1G_07250 [Cordyceps javanica]|uniref:F-box domain-containing protein n=1 Tax=Cordyceps javanica TaxID=43265 RepID=A0A545UY25_9HYPO|nr:hypothetical protein IF1G_07250 [Cordyceps javanica]TQW06241.1 f-box domain-containing protein [Cordyceps javanica]
MPAMDSDAPPPSYDSSISMNNDADILFQTAYKNQIWSPLLRLPDKLLVLLMKSLDLDTLLRLRHTSRVFMWLFNSEAAFEKYHLKLQQDNDRFNDTARVWTPPSAWFKDQAISGFRRISFIDDACGSGWETVVHGPSYDYLDDEDMRGVNWCSTPSCAVANLLRSNKHI